MQPLIALLESLSDLAILLDAKGQLIVCNKPLHDFLDPALEFNHFSELAEQLQLPTFNVLLQNAGDPFVVANANVTLCPFVCT